MDETQINPKIAAALLAEEVSVSLKNEGRKVRWMVSIGPFPFAEGRSRSRKKAYDQIADATKATWAWLEQVAAS